MSKNWEKFTTQAEISQKSKEKGVGGGANFIFPLRPQLTAMAKKILWLSTPQQEHLKHNIIKYPLLWAAVKKETLYLEVCMFSMWLKYNLNASPLQAGNLMDANRKKHWLF